VAPTRFLLDTSALLAHHRQEAGWAEVHTLLQRDDVELLVCAVSLTEFGRRMLDLGATADEVDVLLAAYETLFDAVIDVDAEMARAAFFIGCDTPQRLPLVDAVIAAAAQARSAVLVHRDAHMRPIPSTIVQQLPLADDSGSPRP